MKFLKSAFTNLGYIIGIIIRYNYIIKYNLICSYVYSGWIKSNFKKCGVNTLINKPAYLSGAKCIEIGNNFTCLKGVKLEATKDYQGISYAPVIKIGDNVTINLDCHITCINSITIGDNVLIAGKVFITDHFHGLIDFKTLQIPPGKRLLYSKGSVKIADNVWIGEGAVILPDVVLGENCIIGANSVVTKSFPKNSIIAGVPAQLLRNFEN